jgi:SAM-dependent methyltransferase
MYELEETLWWYVGMRAITSALLDKCCKSTDLRILDAGCGTGIMLEYLRRYGTTFGVDLAKEAIAYCVKRGERDISRASVDTLPFADEEFDLVTSFDVICTLEANEESAIREFRRVLKEDGLVMLRLPAYDWLRGRHDPAVHIEHRYTARELEQTLERLGFEIVKITYCNAWLLPLALIKRLILERCGIGADGSDVKPLPPLVNRAFAAILSSEARLAQGAGIPFGLTIAAIARRVA